MLGWAHHITSKMERQFSRNCAFAHHIILYLPTSALFGHLSVLFLPIMLSVRMLEQKLFYTNKTFGGIDKHNVCKRLFPE